MKDTYRCSHYTPYLNGTGLVSVFCLLSFFAASTVPGGNVFFNHFPALPNRAMIATMSPEMIFTSLKVGAGLHRGTAVKDDSLFLKDGLVCYLTE
ncbi:hypothetical protein ANME2D_02004 [Candidatus Methanoperedens nitroreducens]|uniref:Uncharacterized protein n=1 Tax=Candidatus Methanoperedens nitratireducens TaxID=1392998 RepID=A0A062V3Q3_9EURY|nr:hypothetical protein ANME2D_02004 [Candidatus Methanoperedens nitroreducens]